MPATESSCSTPRCPGRTAPGSRAPSRPTPCCWPVAVPTRRIDSPPVAQARRATRRTLALCGLVARIRGRISPTVPWRCWVMTSPGRGTSAPVTARRLSPTVTEGSLPCRPLMWFRSDLRIHDNTALATAMTGPVIAIFLRSVPHWRRHGHGANKLDFWQRGVVALRESLAGLASLCCIAISTTFDAPASCWPWHASTAPGLSISINEYR
ncbi:hypothetical protein DSL92_01070 [Billgrantia gudaonensis]|uniref:Photolyase/cryptochrome alpha/beta domain-containing protein n=1 Tax=Billgrantia gudaonensis TaxID=376427 RepID=A0A432JKT5_9GAMM|nr:hypothetical protein DSL92_01070 [Halomonas gudaonensis]